MSFSSPARRFLAAMADVAIELVEACRTLPDGKRILDNVALRLSRGESLSIVGRSGCGKSTLLSCLGLVAPFDRGTTYRVDGVDVAALTDRELARLRAASIGFVLQNSGLVPHLSSLENVAVPLMHSSRLSIREIRRRAASKLEMLGVGHLAQRRPVEVSGGERQRVAIARALVIEPRLILADEPTGALDEQTGHLVLRHMLDLVQESAASLIVVTHDPEIAARTGKTARMSEGRLADIGNASP
jgi:ABC-type lipoprotein export system ATPase subunit